MFAAAARCSRVIQLSSNRAVTFRAPLQSKFSSLAPLKSNAIHRSSSLQPLPYGLQNGFCFSKRFYARSNTIVIDETTLDGDLSKFPMSQNTRDRLSKKGVTKLFPVQAATYNEIIEGHDLITRAHTGTGKTLSFVIPIVEKLLQEPSNTLQRRKPRVLVLEPTRELAIQTASEFSAIASLFRTQTVYGGASIDAQGVDIVVGTPGRMVDMIERNVLDLTEIEFVVLDEADAMLKAGFQLEMTAILKEIKSKPQYLLFSATIPSWVTQIAQRYLRPEHKVIDLVQAQSSQTATKIEHIAIPCSRKNRANALADIVRYYSKNGLAIVFTDTKAEATEIGASESMGPVSQVLHGDITQRQREITLRALRDHRFQCLIATDVAARGLDIPNVELVVQLQVPATMDAYIHRSGRTGRAGKTGVSVLLYDPESIAAMKDLERMVGIQFKLAPAPQPQQVLEAAEVNLAEAIKAVPPKASEYFATKAKELLETMEPVQALSAAMAKLSNHTDGANCRSVLTASLGYQTLLLAPKIPFFNLRKAKALLEEITTDVGDCYLTSEGDLAFDVPEILVDHLLSLDQSQYTISKCTEVPDLAPAGYASKFGESGGGYGRFGSRDRGGYGGGREKFGGYGRDKGGFGGRDKGGFGGRDKGGFGGRDKGSFGGSFGGRDKGGFGGSDKGSFGGSFGGRDSFGGRERGFGRDEGSFGKFGSKHDSFFSKSNSSSSGGNKFSEMFGDLGKSKWED